MSTKRVESRKITAEPDQFNFTDIIGNNSWMSDFRQNYLKKQRKQFIDSSSEIHRELFRRYDLCNSLLNMYIKQEILTNLPRVRFKACNDLWECHVKSRETKLTDKMKSFLQVLSHRGFEFLQTEKIFQDFVEIDNTTETFVKYKEKIVNLKIVLDAVCPQEQTTLVDAETTLNTIYESPEIKASSESQPRVDLINNKNVSFDPAKPKKGILKRSRNVESSYPYDRFSMQTVVELDDSDCDEDDVTKHLSNEKPQTKSCDTIILNFVLSVRKSIPAEIVFKQFLSQQVFHQQKNLILVFHIGPLVKDEEMMLYSYECNTEARRFEMENFLNFDQLLITWFQNEGKFVHQFSDSKDSIKNSIYDYQGLEKFQNPTKKKEKVKKKNERAKNDKQNCDDQVLNVKVKDTAT